MNNKGQIIITELLFYVIIITIILSVVIYATTTLTDSQIDTINDNQINSILDQTTNTLIKTSGTPDNWERLPENKISNIGLKEVNTNKISYDKITKLKNNNQLLEKDMPEGIMYSLSIYPKGNEKSKTIISGKNKLYNKTIFTRKTDILLDYGYQIQTIRKDNNTTCPLNHKDTHICKAISINSSSLTNGIYYIVTKDNSKVIISNTYQENINITCNNYVDINKQLEKLSKTENQTFYFHIQNNQKYAYLVYDKNNRKEYLDSIINPKVYVLDMQIAK